MLLGVLQENLLVLLAFDDERAVIIRNTIDIGLFGGQYRQIASRVYDYIDRYKAPPKDHLPDILDDKLNAENKREAELYVDVITSINDAKDTINSEYVMTQLATFVKRQSLRTVAVELTKELQRDTEDSLAKAEELISKAQEQAVTLFDPGLRLDDKKRALDFLDLANDGFPTGIAELDKRGFVPTRKEYWQLIANTKKGKSWMLMHLAKMAVIHRMKVAHVTLELSQERTAQRYFQAFFSISKRQEKFNITKFQRDELGRISGFDTKVLEPALTFDDPKIRSKLEKKIDQHGARHLQNIFVKEFPTGQLTLKQLKAYLDNLERVERFTPDLLVIDYPDLMKTDPSNLRASLDDIIKGLRGIAVERNIAVAGVSQTNRGSARAKDVHIDSISEAFTKVQHADTTITYSQTKAEAELGLARLAIGAGRNDNSNLTVVISQNYGTGNFVVDSVVLKGNYFGLLPKEEGEETAE
jgi:replicative DNA helicase